MKKIIFLIHFVSFLAFEGSGQDLISNTINNTSYRQSILEPNTIAKLIEDRKNQKAIFQEIEVMEFQMSKQTKEYQGIVSEAIFLELNQAKLDKFWNNPAKDISINIPVATGKNILLELTQVNIVSNGFLATTSSGKETLYAPTGIFYHGIVRGNSNSLAAVSLFKDHIRVLIADDGGNYVVGRLNQQSNDYVLYNDKKLKIKNTFTCSTPNFPVRGLNSGLSSNKLKNWDVGDCVGIYFECDFHMYETFNSNSVEVVDYVLELFNEVALLYRREQINIEVSQIFIWTNADPYISTTNTEEALNLFAQTRQNDYNGRLAHLLSTRDLGGGRAYLDVLCNEYDSSESSGPYAVSSGLNNAIINFPTYSWSVNVVTHELGHNFGSQHTHDCVWGNDGDEQIDDCGTYWLIINDYDDDHDCPGDTNSDGCFCCAGDTDVDEPDETETSSCYIQANPIIPANGGTIMSYCHIQLFDSDNNTEINPENNVNFNLGFGPQPGDLIRSRVAVATCLESQCSCEEFTDRAVNGMPILSAVYTANNSITSSGDANETEDNIVIFQAGNLIELTDGFEATELFIAQVIATLCDNDDDSIISIPSELKLGNRNPVSESIRLYPNPASTEVQLSYSLVEDGEGSIHITNQYGQVVKVIEQKAFHQKGKYALKIQLNELPSGVYYVMLSTSMEKLAKPFIIVRF